jgi:hypothetical protein
VTFIQAIMSSSKYGQTNNCGEVAPGASCTATVTYLAGNSGNHQGTFTMTSTAPNSPHVVTLTAGGMTSVGLAWSEMLQRGEGSTTGWSRLWAQPGAATTGNPLGRPTSI